MGNILFLLIVVIASLMPARTRSEDQFRSMEFPSSFFFANKRLVKHTIKTVEVLDMDLCELQCYQEHNCVSFNFKKDPENGKATHKCELNNSTHLENDNELKNDEAYFYRGAKNACGRRQCRNNGICQSGFTSKGYRCVCPVGFKGHDCERARRGLHSHMPADSCKDIRDSGDSKGDGEYWIDPEKNRNPLKVYCDMTTDGGGWLLIFNVVMQNSTPPSRLPVKDSYRGISSDQMVLNKWAMKEMRKHLSFTKLRFHCSKHQGRTFHVTTTTNSTGEAVVQYFSGEKDVQPDSCGSFVRMENDNSNLARVCEKWGHKNRFKVGKWGASWITGTQKRLYDHSAFVEGQYHWLLKPKWPSRWECDDIQVAVSCGDFWKVYAR